MPSETVWFEQVDNALVEYIQNIIKIKNSEGNLVPVPVRLRKADEDFKVEDYPCTTVYSLYSIRDEQRYNSEKVIVSRDPETNTMVLENNAIPYNLFYQIDFWSKYQTEMNEMTRRWIANHPEKSFNLPVKDMSGNDRSCFVLIYDTLTKSDQLSGTSRILHSVLTLKIWVEIDERIPIITDMISAIPNTSVESY